MASQIKIKRSSVAGKVPTTSDIATGELAINTKDRKIYSSNGTAVFNFGADYLQVANASTLYPTKYNPTTSGLFSHTGRVTISTNLTVSGNTSINGTLIANGSVGTSGYYLRSSGTGVYWSPVSVGGGAGSFVTTVSKSFDALKGTDTVITAVNNVASAANYLQVANSAVFALKSEVVILSPFLLMGA